MKVISNGVFQGDNTLVYALPLVILQMCLVVFVTRLLDFLLTPRRQPRVIAEIVKSPQGPQKEVIGNIDRCYQMEDEGADSGTAPCADFDVFLSFRGPDTRDTFADCLYEYMNRTGIRIFRDEEALGPGKNISEILGAVKRSQIYIIVFSQGYASSRWCLRELTCMVECSRQSTGKEILPIFFDVEPSDVKLETEMYYSAINKHEEELGCAEVKPWKEALTTVARIKGWCVKGRRQGKVIADITEKVLQKITIRKRYLPTDLVGIDDHVEAIKKLLSCDTGGIRFVIIHGIGGIGKTTLAETVYNQLFPQFEGHSFLSNIHESSSCRGMLKMQRKLVEDLFGFLLHETIDPKEGNNMIKEILPKKRVLLVLDDMDEKDQFMNMAMNSYSYGPGSRIIITTRDFPMTNVDGLEENILTRSGHIFSYEMKEMHFDHAHLLFNKLAFNTDSAPCDLSDLSRQVVELTGGLPLAVEVIGSHLRTISKAKWKTTLKKLKEVPHEKVRQRLQISYDALGCEGQQIFLDIGCFFVNKKKANAMYMWEASDFYPEVEIDILIRKSLIKIQDDRILMHGQLRDLAREIIRQENIRNCGDRSRLWFIEMSLAQKGTKNVVALTPRRSRHNFTREDFANFANARYLRLDGGNFADDCEDILPELRWLCWQNCPSKLRANNLVLNRLVVLKLSGNITTEEWSGWVKIMVASKLKVLKIAGSKSLIKTPHFSEFMSLERLVLKDCLMLAEIDSSIGELRQLSYLKIKWCPRLRELPNEIGCLTALKELILIQGHSVCDLPESIGNIRGLSRLVMEDTGLVELPDTIRGLEDLKHLSLVNCTNLNSLPDAVGELKSLTELDLSGTTIGNLPRFIWDLENLTVRMNSFGIRTPPMRDLPMQGLGVRHSPDSTGNLRSWLRLSMDERGSVGFPETSNGLGDHEYLHLADFTGLNSLSDAVGELRTSTESYLSWTAIWEQEMEEMHFDHALQLFSEHSFYTDSAPCDLYDLSRQVVEPNGSHGDGLCRSNGAKQLPWRVLLDIIAMEVCSALAFLHACKPHSIVHRDLKPGNILLDAPTMSKLSDFGICRLLSGGDWLTHNTTVLYPTYPKGTFGYMDPEFLVKRELTTKFDVFSFGITLLQLLTRRPALGKANVVQRATSAGILEAMLDPLAGERPYMVAEESTHLVLSCCEMSRRNKLDPRRVGSAPMERSFQGVSTKPVTPVPEDRIYVAVGKNMKKSKANLAWALHQSGGKVKTCIIHVLVPTQAIPMGGLGVKIPANSANEIMLREHRENEGINMHKILDTYLVVCQKMGVPVGKEYVESNIVQKGFVELIRLHGIRKLVMSGAAARRYFKYVQEQTTYLSENREVSRLHITRKVTVGSAAANLHFRNMAEIKSRKAIFFRYKAHSSCPFICHRDPPSLTTSTPGAGNSILLKSQSATLQRSGRAKLSNPFRDILKRAFSSAYRCEAMPIASPSPDSIPSVQPSATGIVKRQETSKKSEGFQRVLPIVGIRFSQTSSSADFLLTLKKMKEVLEMTEDHLDTVMEKLRAAQAQKSQLKDQFVETVRMNSFGIRTLMRDLLMQGLSVLHPLDSIGHLRSRLRLSMGDRGSAGFLETINGLGDQESLHLSDFTHLNSLSDTVGELRRTTELYLSGTANREQEMEEMQFDHALQLFSEHAFHTDLAPCDLYDLSRQVVELTGGLPLAVEVIGSHLRTTSKAKWKTTLKKLKELPYEKVRQRLQISYDALGCEGQQIFLDIGCFFVNQKKANAMYMWEARDFYPEVETDILIRKSLIKIHDDRILMHGQLRDLAREIISQENIRNCGHRSRLWFLEMSLAQKVSEEVERAISRFLDPSLRALSIPVGTIEECSLRLQFVTKLSATIFTSSQIEAEDGTPLRIKLVDGRTKERVTSGLLSLLKLDIVLLKHVFGSDEGEDWTVKDFNGNIIREREGKRPLITGELPVVLQGGIGCLRNLIITDNSSWMRSRKFRLGARAVQKVSAETRILEALSETFIVKDHRGELSKKHHPPSLSDEVWRLEKVAKGGALHECITSRRINTVQDFLQLYKANASSLRNILGTGIANQIWETIIRHASTCVLDDNKMYSYYPASNKTGILFNSILKVVQATLDGQTYELLEKLTQSQKNLKWQAYNNKNQWVPLDALPSITPPRALTNLHTEPLVVVSPPPSHHLDYTVLNQDGREVTPEFNYSFGFSTALLQCHREQTI